MADARREIQLQAGVDVFDVYGVDGEPLLRLNIRQYKDGTRNMDIILTGTQTGEMLATGIIGKAAEMVRGRVFQLEFTGQAGFDKLTGA